MHVQKIKKIGTSSGIIIPAIFFQTIEADGYEFNSAIVDMKKENGKWIITIEPKE